VFPLARHLEDNIAQSAIKDDARCLMPKGQYPRKPRNPASEAVEPAAPASLYQGDATHFPSEPPRVYTDPAEVPEPFHFEPNEVQARMMAEEQAREYAAGMQWTPDQLAAIQAAPLQPAPPKRPNFDDWADEDAPVIPADDMVTRKVHAWAATVCAIPFQVTWQPENDAKAIEVLLVTEHGASRLRKPAGNWTEPAIDEALEAMRADLMV
jgi:hypothetical protein